MNMSKACPQMAPPLLAAEPFGAGSGICTKRTDTCQPAEMRFETNVQGSDKAIEHRNETNPQEATPLVADKMVQLIFSGSEKSHLQLRISPGCKFNFLYNTPNSDAHKGKDLGLYRGQCHEG